MLTWRKRHLFWICARVTANAFPHLSAGNVFPKNIRTVVVVLTSMTLAMPVWTMTFWEVLLLPRLQVIGTGTVNVTDGFASDFWVDLRASI